MSHPAYRTTPLSPPPERPKAPSAPPHAANAAPAESTWRSDLGAGVVVALVALPLCLGIALASGAPLFAGIVTGIVGGVLVSRLSGSQLLVSGPAAGLTAIVVSAIAELGTFEVFLVAALLAGAMQLLLGALRAGIIAYFVPSSVIRGMLAGIGVLLIVKQLPHLVGSQAASGLFTPGVAAIGLASLALLFTWDKFVPASARKIVPAPLAVVLLSALGAWALSAFATGQALPGWAFVALPVPERLSDVTALLARPDWSALANPKVYSVAATIAIVASLETLLSLEATDKLDPQRRTSPANRELLAQGAGNVVAAALGGLPMTGVIVRSAANVNAGAKTWRSSFIHGVLLAIAVFSIPALLNRIPLAALAAVLIATGFKLAHPKLLVEAWKRGPQFAVPFVVTVLAIVIEDLLLGIAVGLTAGIFFVLRDSYRNAYSYERRQSADQSHMRLTLAEEVTFLNKAKLSAALGDVPAGSTVTIDATRTKHLDMDVAELLHDFQQTGTRKGITVLLRDVPAPLHAATAH